MRYNPKTMEGSKVFANILQVVEANTKKTENYLSSQPDVSNVFRDSLKSLYDYIKDRESSRKTAALPELITDGFDAEQIWQQLELQNEGEFPRLLTGTSKALTAANRLKLPVKLCQDKEEEEEEGKEAEENSVQEDRTNIDDSEASSEDEDLERPKKKLKTGPRRKSKPSIVDDAFFKLQELDEYLNIEDKRAFQDGKEKERDDDEESIDLFDYVSESEDGEDDPRLVKFKDFFDAPESGRDYEDEGEEDGEEEQDSEEDKEESMLNPSYRRVKFDLLKNSESENEDEGKETKEEFKSSLETRQERLRSRIEELEEAAISEKPWQLKGEVDAANRPQNSLLEEHVEFDITSRPAPIITEQTTLKLEDIIRQRIKDKAWDDVEKKIKPVETPMEYKKKLVLDQEKSKVSLAQIYENEYLKQKEALDPDNEDKEKEEPKEHIEIREMMHSLFSKLDALSNFHYTPKLARPDIKIVSNLPAVTMEEVAPVATSDATLLAPEEIKAKSRGDMIGRSERTDTDMKRERRQKKLKQREREKAKEKREKIVEKLRPGLGNKYSKEKASKMIDKLSKERNITKIDENSGNRGSTKSSTAFFDQLQDQVKTHINIKSGNTKAGKKKDKKSLSAVKLKL